MAFSLEASLRVLRHGSRLLLLRAELAAEELALARQQWLGWLAAVLAAFALLLAALVAAVAWLTLVLWDRFGAATPGVAALALALAAAWLLRRLMLSAAEAPPPFSRTRTAVREDYEAIAGAIAAKRSAEPGP